MNSWSLDPVFDSYLVVGLAGAVLLGLLLIVRYGAGLNWRRRMLLRGLRLLIIVLVLLAMLRPTHVSSSRKPQSAVLIVLIDQTESMEFPSSEAGVSRWEHQLDILRRVEPLLQTLHQSLTIKIYGYSDQLHPIAWDGTRLEVPGPPLGERTDISTTVFRALERELNQRLAAIVLLGDGTQTTFDPPIEMRKLGQEMQRLGVPLYAVPFGDGGSPEYSRDVVIKQLAQQYTVYVKNQLAVRSVVEVRGYVNQPITVQMVVLDRQGTETVVETRQVTAHRDDEQIPVAMTYIPQQAGQYTLRMRAEQQDGELLWENNELTAFLNVMEGGLRIYYLYGSRIGEQLELRRSIASSPYMEVVEQFIGIAGRARWPDPRAAIEEDQPFDVIIIENLNARAIGTEQLQQIATAVENGTGLMMVGGYHSFGPGEYAQTPLAAVLPVEMQAFERQPLGLAARLQTDFHVTGEIAMVPIRPHAVSMLATPQENRQRWSELPPLQGANRIISKNTGRVLVASANNDPLLVAGDYGAGRVLAFAGDSTWRWRREGFETELHRFWRQSMLWLAHRDEQQHHDAWIRLQQRRFLPGEDVPVMVGLTSSSGATSPDASWDVSWQGPSGDRQPLQVSPDGDHWQGLIAKVQEPGEYTLTVKAMVAGTLVGPVEASFEVIDQKPEKSKAAADLAQLARLVRWTEEAGGRIVAPNELPSLLQKMNDDPPELDVEIQSRWQLGQTTADAWSFFMLLVVLVGGEWFLRKKWGLV
jgi:uncharacterized membrane protein